MRRSIIALGLCAAVCSLIPAAEATKSFLSLYQKGEGTLVVDYMLGGDIDDPANFFYQPSDLAIDSQGHLFVLDYKGHCIKKFAPDGNLLLTFGGKGEGPGEMIGAHRMAVDPGGSIVIFDIMNSKRFSFFDAQGVFVRSVSLTEFGYRNIVDFDIDSRGRLFVQIHKSDYFTPDGKTVVSVAQLDLETKHERTVDSLAVRDMYSRQDENTWQMASTPYHPELLWAISPSGNIIIADSDTYRIRIYSPDLKLIAERRYDGKKRPVTDKDKQDYFEAFEGDNTLQWLRRIVDFPERKPYFDRLYVDHEGYILLCIDDETQEFDVLDPGGERINTIRLPKLGRTAIIVDGFIYTTGIHREEDYVVYRYRLE